MKYALFEIAALIAGYSFREKMPFDQNGTLAVVQSRDINAAGDIDTTSLDRIEFPPQHEKHLLRFGDIPIINRGPRNTALLVTESWPDTIVPSYFTVIRVRSNSVLPGFLRAYLNHSKTQARIREMAQGTAIRAVPSSMLGSLSINIPSLDIQHLFAELDLLDRHANKLEEKIQFKRRALIEQEMTRLMM